MPQGDIFHRRDRRAAHHAGEAGEVFGQHRVALVRHGRRALLAGREIFLRFQNFGALQMADLGRQPFDRRGNDTERREIHRMPVARDDLRRDGLERQPQLLGDMRLDAGVDIGEGADRARDRAGGDFRARGLEAGAAAVELGIGLGELEAECGRLAMDAMAAADGRRVLVLHRPALDRLEQRVQVVHQDVGGARELHGKAGVEHVRAGHALVHEARLVAHLLGHPGQEGDDIVFGDSLDRVDRGDVDHRVGRPPGPECLGGGLGHDSDLGERIGGVRLDLEPDAELCLRLPDGGHLRAGITGDHEDVLAARADRGARSGPGRVRRAASSKRAGVQPAVSPHCRGRHENAG